MISISSKQGNRFVLQCAYSLQVINSARLAGVTSCEGSHHAKVDLHVIALRRAVAKKKYTEFVIPCLADDASRSCSVVTGSARYARRSTSPSKRRAPNLATWHQNCHRWYVLPFRATAAGCGNHQVDATERIENKDNMAAMARRATFGVRCDHRTDEPNPKDIFC